MSELNASYEKAKADILRAAKGKLSDLSLANRGLTAVPPEIGECSRLQALNLRQNRLATLPPEIGGCKNLRILQLDDNQITNLPKEMGQCYLLQNLSLANHCLTRLPLELRQCTSLSELNLRGGTQLKEWPEFDRAWPKLKGLSLSECRLGAVPPSLCRCKELRALYLDKNYLQLLPHEIRDLPLLERLYLHENEALALPQEVLGPTWHEVRSGKLAAPARVILDYYFSRQDRGAQSLDEVRLVLVGRGGVGKSTIVERLIHDRFVAGKPETIGVALSDWQVQNCPNGGPVTAHIWDFAGQVITHSIHQFFFSIRTVYLLVLTGRENCEREDAEYWLRLISAYGTDEKGVGPPTIVALNKWDDQGASRAKIDRRALCERYSFILDIIETDCATGRGIDSLKKRFAETVGASDWVRLSIAKSWSMVKNAIARQPTSHLGFDTFRHICVESGVTNEREQESLAETLHRLGVALNYRMDDRLRDATVLKPHWLTDNVYRLLRYAERENGMIHARDLPRVLSEEKDDRMRQYLIDLMVRFEIAYPIGDDDSTTAWLAPQGLPDSQPDGVEWFSKAEATRLRYSYKALPSGLVPRFIVRTHPFIENEKRWASGVVLTLNGARALVRATLEDKQVEITVAGPDEPRQELAGLCLSEFRAMHAEIRGLNPAGLILVDGDWVPVDVLERDEAAGRVTGIRTDEGTRNVDPSESLNQLTAPAARNDSWKPRVFISYSHTDEIKRKKLELHLKILANAGLIEATWHDRKIQPGDDWDRAILAELSRATVVIMLVSTASLASDYIRTKEMTFAIERAGRGETRLVAILLEPCLWTTTALTTWSVLPRDAKDLTSWNPRAAGWLNVAEGLQELFTSLVEKQERSIDGQKP